MEHEGPLELRLLDERGFEFIEERLREGKTLAQTLLKKLPLRAGTVSALVAPAVTERQLYSFSEGSAVPQLSKDAGVHRSGYVWVEVVGTYGRLQLALTRRLEEQGIVVVGVDWMSKPSDPLVVRSAVRPWLFGDEVYFAACWLAPDRIGAVMENGSDAWPGLLAIVCTLELPVTGPWDSLWALSEQTLEQVADTASEMWVGAYDNESYVLWTRDDHVRRFYVREFAVR